MRRGGLRNGCVMWNRDYGFVDVGPADHVYAVTSDYEDLARNHCAVTMLVNAVISCLGAEPVCQDRRALFVAIHRFVGNGPVLRLQNRANRYFQSAGLPIRCRQVNRRITERRPDRLTDLVQRELAAGRPCALMVAASPLDWHWVLALAAKQDRAGSVLFCIADGWHARRVYWYTPDAGSRLMAIAAFGE